MSNHFVGFFYLFICGKSANVVESLSMRDHFKCRFTTWKSYVYGMCILQHENVILTWVTHAHFNLRLANVVNNSRWVVGCRFQLLRFWGFFVRLLCALIHNAGYKTNGIVALKLPWLCFPTLQSLLLSKHAPGLFSLKPV